MDREIRYIIICDSFDFFINVHYWIFKMIDWTTIKLKPYIFNIPYYTR